MVIKNLQTKFLNFDRFEHIGIFFTKGNFELLNKNQIHFCS